MNETKNQPIKQNQKNQRQQSRHEQGPKRRGQNATKFPEPRHEDQEYPETRMYR